MASRPLPGASYHTADLAFHSCSDVDLEAVDSYASEKGRVPFQTSQQGNARLRRGPPVMLILLLLCCLSFVASAYVGRASADQFIMPLFCVPERHAPRAAQLSAAFRTSPNKEWVYGTQEKALDILKQKYNSSRVGCHAANVRDYMRQTHSVVESSLEWADVSESAIVLHWQGSDSKLKPVIIANTDEVLDQEVVPINPFDQCEEEPIEHFEELADVESAIGMLTAVEALAQSGYQPSRTLVFSLMLGEAADIRKVSDYLHATYEKHGLEMGFKQPPVVCGNMTLDRMLHTLRILFGRLYVGVTALFSVQKAPHCLQSGLDNGEPRVHRYVFFTEDEVKMRELLATELSVWTHVILETGL